MYRQAVRRIRFLLFTMTSDSVETLFEEFPKEIAAVIVEPVAANMGRRTAEEGISGRAAQPLHEIWSAAHF